MMEWKAKNSGFFILVLVFLNILAWIVVFELNRPPILKVVFFDVGQGDAIFIESPEKHQILIDGGPGPAVLEKLSMEMPFWDRDIDLIILSHPEHDHLAGLIEVLKRYKVENILWTGVIRDTTEFEEWDRLIKEEKAEIKIAKSGQRIIAGTCLIEILYPPENLEGKKLENSNNTSIISRLIFSEVSFLFTGDAYKSVEKKITVSGANLESDVLKIGHHGSKTSSGEDFIRMVSPEVAVISVGKDNSYGHPHQGVLETLSKYGIKILRTDEDGDIKIISDGEKIKLER